jgi:phenylacetate-CoA ligase
MYQMKESQWWPREQLRAQQLRQLELLLAHASRTVPFYQGRLTAIAGLRRGELTMEHVGTLPLLTRGAIQEAGDSLHSVALPKEHGKTSTISTSGSTGRPVTVRTTQVTSLFFRALNLRYHQWHGRDFAAKAASILRLHGAVADDEPVNWVPGYRSGPMVRFDVTRPLREQLDWLLAEEPAYLLTYPGNLRSLVEFSLETGRRPQRLRQIATMGEVMDASLRQLCARAWGVTVTDAYSSQEVGMLALQAPGGEHYLIQEESILLEAIDESGNPTPPGAVGRVVVTDLHNFAMPLIRYEIGDFAEVGPPSPCGRGLGVLTRILGRSRNMLRLPDGSQVWPVFSTAMSESLTPLRQIQLVQRQRDRVAAILVVARPLTAAEEAEARAIIGRAVRQQLAVDLEYVAEISRSVSGKFEEVRCEIAP